MPNYDFKKDLQVALKTEIEVADLLYKKYEGLKILNIGHTNEYDILASFKDEKIMFEVKEDLPHARTGNIGLEFECRGKLSGISVSKSQYYIYKVHNSNNTCSVYLIKTAILKDMVTNKLYFRIVNGGDAGSNSMNYLFRDSVFYKYAIKIA